LSNSFIRRHSAATDSKGGPAAAEVGKIERPDDTPCQRGSASPPALSSSSAKLSALAESDGIYVLDYLLQVAYYLLQYNIYLTVGGIYLLLVVIQALIYRLIFHIP
jgi:hypothetical protein